MLINPASLVVFRELLKKVKKPSKFRPTFPTLPHKGFD
jgi:hypothetical protein